MPLDEDRKDTATPNFLCLKEDAIPLRRSLVYQHRKPGFDNETKYVNNKIKRRPSIIPRVCELIKVTKKKCGSSFAPNDAADQDKAFTVVYLETAPENSPNQTNFPTHGQASVSP